ncbi:esterase-like activity of phytase family protein [Hydrogenimonas cancrithermarum]|uniref:Lipoprotein n=1 Tax=Hydrogenimonas cancrithermarum TaxID=2993563 RepID=A0ABM8FJP6_9BACT|nr:esterase-like activity of phytase family protein [Hydrogenimonas cancrithermarum]BDY12516.1 lipoprotein [Hydrogenimonas cancrithermarum]
MKIILFLSILFGSLHADMEKYDLSPASAKRMVEILDAKAIRFSPKNGIPFTGVSDLAYDSETKTLYAISDEGYLYVMKLRIGNGKIEHVALLKRHRLKDESGRPLHGKKWRDAEGLALTPKGLAVSFERKPRIVLYTPRGGYMEKVKISKILQKKSHYRGKNSMLEGVARHPVYGIVTAPERPLEKQDAAFHTIYAKMRRWRFPATAALTAIEVMPNGDFLVLERSYDWLTRRRRTILSRVHSRSCEQKVCRTERLADLDSEQGWHLDNFEGLTHVEANRYLMISDDNGNPFQKTVLVLFEIFPKSD